MGIEAGPRPSLTRLGGARLRCTPCASGEGPANDSLFLPWWDLRGQRWCARCDIIGGTRWWRVPRPSTPGHTNRPSCVHYSHCVHWQCRLSVQAC